MRFRGSDLLPLPLELFVTHFMVDERHPFAMCRATTAFWVEDILPSLANALTAPAAIGMVIPTFLVHYKDLHRATPLPFTPKASWLELAASESHVEVESILWRSFRATEAPLEPMVLYQYFPNCSGSRPLRAPRGPAKRAIDGPEALASS